MTTDKTPADNEVAQPAQPEALQGVLRRYELEGIMRSVPPGKPKDIVRFNCERMADGWIYMNIVVADEDGKSSNGVSGIQAVKDNEFKGGL